MREQLEEFEREARRVRSGWADNDDPALIAGLRRREPTVERILQALDPRLAEGFLSDVPISPAAGRAHVQRALGMLADRDEWARRLAPQAPALPADRLHPWVWEAARTFWDSGHYRAAVHTAASAINAHLQQKLGRRDVSDDKLVQEAFSDAEPQPNRPRLRVPGDHANPTVQSRQRGARMLGLGVFFAIRNPAAHEPGELPEQEALEELATMSVLKAVP